ncbi:MAG: HAMP domain-containing protein, partial [Nitrospirales bacterium]
MPESKGGVRAFFQRSIFLKLFLIYAATTLVLVLAISGFSRLVLSSDDRFKQTRGKMLAHHLNHLMDQMGNPPSRERAVQLSRQLGLQIRLESAEGAWTTDPALPASSALHVRRTLAESDMQLGRYRGRRFAIMDRGSQRFLFFLSERPELEVGSAALLVGMIALILGGSYLMVRWLFRPLDWLTQGVTEIGRGNLHHQVPLRSPDELGQLTTALNDMTTRVRDMLRARDRLLLDVSHELRSPLTRMKVALEFVQEEPTREKLHQDIRQLEAMVTELLESERL